MACGRQSTERKPARAERVKEWYKTNKALFSTRGACAVQMEGFLLRWCGGEFWVGGVLRPGTGNDWVEAAGE